MSFLPESVRVEPIRVEDAYGGRRATIEARIGKARLTVQVDIGIGDAVTPGPEWLEYPGLLDLPRARLRVYSRGSVVAFDAATGRRLWQRYMIDEAPRQRGVTRGGAKVFAPSGRCTRMSLLAWVPRP